MKVDRAFVEPGHQLHRGLGQPRLGIAVGGRVIAVDVAEVALPLHQRIAQREILREADHRIIDRSIAVRVILADNVAHHARRFLVGAGGIELQLAHRPQQTAVDGLEAVAQVRERARGNRRQRIDEVALAQRAVEWGIDNGIERIGIFNGRGSHGRDP